MSCRAYAGEAAVQLDSLGCDAAALGWRMKERSGGAARHAFTQLNVICEKDRESPRPVVALEEAVCAPSER